MRKLFNAFAIVVLALGVAGTAQASTFAPDQSTISVSLGAINSPGPVALPGTEAMVTLADDGFGGHTIALASTVWSTINFGAGTSLYTGIPLISNIKITVQNNAASFGSGFTHTNYLAVPNAPVGPFLGGQSPLKGKLVLSILKGLTLVTFDLTPVGGPAGGTQSATVGGLVTIDVTNSPWITGAQVITGITTNVVSINGEIGAGIALRLTPDMAPYDRDLSTGGGYVETGGGLPLEYHTVTVTGANDLLSASGSGGVVTLVSPMRIDTTAAISGRVPGAAWLDMVFVPEPGVMLLLVTGAIGLVVVGHRRMRK